MPLSHSSLSIDQRFYILKENLSYLYIENCLMQPREIMTKMEEQTKGICEIFNKMTFCTKLCTCTGCINKKESQIQSEFMGKLTSYNA